MSQELKRGDPCGGGSISDVAMDCDCHLILITMAMASVGLVWEDRDNIYAR